MPSNISFVSKLSLKCGNKSTVQRCFVQDEQKMSNTFYEKTKKEIEIPKILCYTML